ncbi:MAG TPA: beta-glucosidase, partial [Dokdonella sp.]
MDAPPLAAPTSGARAAPLLGSFFLGGFECSTHRLDDGRRLDLIESTRHDRFAAADYRALRAHGIRGARDGLRWHRIETAPGVYDWSSFVPVLRAAAAAGVGVIWDLCHYGWPDTIDVWRAEFVERFARFAGEVARIVREETPGPAFYCPVNEISYWAWAGGDVGHFSPAAFGRGVELKRQLVRAAIAAIDAIRARDPHARFVAAEPIIHVAARTPDAALAAERKRLSQFETWDMLCGRRAPELGGTPRHLDVLGLNFYSHNQWYVDGGTIAPDEPVYRPLHRLLVEIHERYARPMLIAE